MTVQKLYMSSEYVYISFGRCKTIFETLCIKQLTLHNTTQLHNNAAGDVKQTVALNMGPFA
jgi:hypothetical protein